MKILALLPLFIAHLAIGQQTRKQENRDWIVGEWVSDKSTQPRISIIFYPKGLMTFSIDTVRYIHNYEFISAHSGKVKVTSSVDNSLIGYFNVNKKDDTNLELLTDKGKKFSLTKTRELRTGIIPLLN